MTMAKQKADKPGLHEVVTQTLLFEFEPESAYQVQRSAPVVTVPPATHPAEPALETVVPVASETMVREVDRSVQVETETADPVEYGPFERPKGLVVFTIEVKDQTWVANGMVICPDGEVLDVLEATGFVAADGVAHAGWLLAVCEAMRLCQKVTGPINVEIGIRNHFVVGFLVVTLPGRVQELGNAPTEEYGWPNLYREFIDLKQAIRPTIRWVWGAS